MENQSLAVSEYALVTEDESNHRISIAINPGEDEKQEEDFEDNEVEEGEIEDEDFGSQDDNQRQEHFNGGPS